MAYVARMKAAGVGTLRKTAMYLLSEPTTAGPAYRERCCRGTFRSDVGRVIVGAAGGSDTCRFQSISICRSRSGAWKCSRALVGGEAGPLRIRRRLLPRVTARARRSVAWRGAMV